MSFQDSSDISIPFETPDRSLGSLSLSATGEQLDDIQVSFDRMYIDSPQPSSLLSGVGADSALASSTPLRGNVFATNQLSTSPDAAGFDRLALMDEEEIKEVVESVDWLRDVPEGLPINFTEDDRSFLDTGLLNIRYNLLNYVTHVINAGAISSRDIDTRTYTRPKKSKLGRGSALRSKLNTTLEVCSFQSENGDSSSPPLELSSYEGENGEPSQSFMEFTANHGNNGFASSPAEPLPIQQPSFVEESPPQRPLYATMNLSPNRSPKLKSLAAYGSAGKLNTTITMSPERSPKLGLLSASGTPHRLNTTFDMSLDDSSVVEGPPMNGSATFKKSPHRKLNTTMEIADHNQVGGLDSPSSVNLNETFVAENGESPSSERSRRVTRNLSYVIRRDEESPNNNSSPQVSANASRCDLNSTFGYEHEADREPDPQGTRSSRNTSMEDLNSRVASQIRSLGCSTITRGRYSEHGARGAVPNLDETRLVARTSSTDTYSVAHSSESPTSSGLSSPMDAQSYDDIQSSSEVVRRSMPNLAVIRNATTIRTNLAFPQTGGGQLRKNHYISDSRLSRLGSGDSRPRMRVRGSEGGSNSSFNQGLRPSENSHVRVGANTSTPAALNRISSGLGPTSGASRVYSAQALGSTTTSRASSATSRPQGSSMGNVRTTGLAGPRYTGGLRPPRPTPTVSVSQFQHPANPAAPTSRAFTAPGIPVPTFRTQSRIPAPGQLRFSRPSQIARPPGSGGTYSKSTGAAALRGPVDDWRDGCY